MPFKLKNLPTYTEFELQYFLEEVKLLKLRFPKEQKYENRLQQIKSELRKKGEPIK